MQSTVPSEVEGNRIVINVGGKRHETHALTLRNIPDTRLAWLAEAHMKSEQQDGVARKEYFFDRHPDIFGVILNYYRTGTLHSPRDICGPLFEEELQFWGIEEKDMEACCWPYFTQHRDAEKNLDDFVGPEFEESDDDGEDTNSPREDDFNAGNCWERYRPKIWAILDDAFSSTKAKVVAYISLFMIVASVISMCAASVGNIKENVYLKIAEYIFCAWFTLELVVRFIFCPSKKLFLKGVLNWVDFIALLPYYSEILFPDNSYSLGFLRVFRLVRIFRLFRFFSYTSGLQVIVKSLKSSARELFLLVIILLLPVTIFSSILYEIEKGSENQPHFNSIPETFWWAIITMTTVGYGDMTPVSTLGRVVGGICALCGVIIVALPVSVIGNNFNTYYTHAQARLSLPKKKRRLIMGGDMNQLARLQGKSTSSLGSDPAPDIKMCHSDADEETTRNYRRYHRRSRNTLFAGGGVYIGAVNIRDKPEEKEKIPIVENNTASLPRNFRLVNTTHESEEYIEQETKRKIVFKMQEDSPSDTHGTGSSESSCRKDTLRVRSASDLQMAESASQATRLRSGKTFRTKVTPTELPKTESNLKSLNELEMVPQRLPVITDYWSKLDNTKLDRPPDDSNGQSHDQRTKTENGVFLSERRRNCVPHITNGHVL